MVCRTSKYSIFEIRNHSQFGKMARLRCESVNHFTTVPTVHFSGQFPVNFIFYSHIFPFTKKSSTSVTLPSICSFRQFIGQILSDPESTGDHTNDCQFFGVKNCSPNSNFSDRNKKYIWIFGPE